MLEGTVDWNLMNAGYWRVLAVLTFPCYVKLMPLKVPDLGKTLAKANVI